MNAAVSHRLAVNDSELDLLAELLDRECSELPHEIHHTSKASVREDLRRRMEAVQNLLERVKAERGAISAKTATPQ